MKIYRYTSYILLYTIILLFLSINICAGETDDNLSGANLLTNNEWDANKVTESDIDWFKINVEGPGVLEWQLYSYSGGPFLILIAYENGDSTSPPFQSVNAIPGSNVEKIRDINVPSGSWTYYAIVQESTSNPVENGLYKIKALFEEKDINPPKPNPTEWLQTPYPASPNSIQMSCKVSSDPEGNPVEYYFDFVEGSGGNDSGWISQNVYEDKNLQPNSSYGYEVKTRDPSSNETTPANKRSCYTLAAIPPAPTIENPTSTTIDLTPSKGENPLNTKLAIYNKTLNYFLSRDGSSNGSTEVWLTEYEWETVTVTGLSSGTTYEFQVKAINHVLVETEFGQSNSGTTLISEDPIASANEISDQPSYMYPDIQYSITSKYQDPNGRDDIHYCYFRINHPALENITLQWDQNTDTLSIQEGADFITVNGVQVLPLETSPEGYVITWTFSINSEWQEAENGINFSVSVKDDSNHEDGWNTDRSDASFTPISAAGVIESITTSDLKADVQGFIDVKVHAYHKGYYNVALSDAFGNEPRWEIKNNPLDFVLLEENQNYTFRFELTPQEGRTALKASLNRTYSTSFGEVNHRTETYGKRALEVGDAIYRDGVVVWDVFHNRGHAGIFWFHDVEKDYIIHSDTNNEDGVKWPDGVYYGFFDESDPPEYSNFLQGKTFCGARNLGDMTEKQRINIIYEAQYQINSGFAGGILDCDYPVSDDVCEYIDIIKPATSFQKGDGEFRCDGLVRYCYDKVLEQQFPGFTPRGQYDNGKQTTVTRPEVDKDKTTPSHGVASPNTEIKVIFTELMGRFGIKDAVKKGEVKVIGSNSGLHSFNLLDKHFEENLCDYFTELNCDEDEKVKEDVDKLFFVPWKDNYGNPARHDCIGFTIHSDIPFEYGETVTVTIPKTLKDLGGNPLENNYTFSFEIIDLRPKDLIITPSMWTSSNILNLSWSNPTGTSITKAYIKFGSAPSSNTDFKTSFDNPTGNHNINVSNHTSSKGKIPIYVWLEDEFGNLDYNEYTSATIYYDPDLPYSPKVNINNGTEETHSLIVDLGNLGALDDLSGVTEMRFSNNAVDWSPRESLKPEKINWDLTSYGGNSDEGVKQVYVEYFDAADNSIIASDSIMYIGDTPCYPTAEICGDKTDNDCDGIVDEECEPPVFDVDIKLNKDPIEICFTPDQPLNEDPVITLLSGNGTLSPSSGSTLSPVNVSCSKLLGYCVNYVIDNKDSAIKIKIGEDSSNPIIGGNPASEVAGFVINTEHEKATSLCLYDGTIGGGSLKDDQCDDILSVVIDSEALDLSHSGLESEDCILLRIVDVDPTSIPSSIPNTKVTGVCEINLPEGVEIKASKTIILTISFELPLGWSRDEFENNLQVLYYDEKTDSWKSDGISNVNVHWDMMTVTFETSHLTQFAVSAAQDNTSPQPSSANNDRSKNEGLSGIGCSLYQSLHNMPLNIIIFNILSMFFPLIIQKAWRWRNSKRYRG